MPPSTESPASLDSVLATDELSRRTSRPADYQAENHAMVRLAREMHNEPAHILGRLTEAAMQLCRADAAGISFLEEENGRQIFRWYALSGIIASYAGYSTERSASPCGIVLDRNAPQLFLQPAHFYSYLQMEPAIEEGLLLPFSVGGEVVGTLWVVINRPDVHFDGEDVRVLENLAEFASAAYSIRSTLSLSTVAQAAAEAANRAKDRFLAVLSHELRTPLTPVLMTVAARAMDHGLSDELRDDLEMIRRNVELQTTLIDDLLDLSSIRNGKLRLHPVRVDVNESVSQVCQICLSQSLEKGIPIHLDLDAGVHLIDADPSRLQQMLWNVIKNAAKFTPDGGEIFISTRNTDRQTVSIIVRDTGPGIGLELLPSIFNAFEQGEQNITREFGGLGLGLAISKALVELHGGTIRAESAGTGHGSTFTIELPSLPMGTSEPAVALPATAETARALSILIAEDHVDTALMLAQLLTLNGYAVKTAHSVKQALEIAGGETFDLVISDLGLPDATGYELMRKLRARSDVKGIAMSGYGMADDIQKSLEAGFSEHLIKPVSVARLEQTILRVTK